MENKLKDYFIEFKNCSLSLIEAINIEDYDALEKKIEERQTILDAIRKLEYSKEEIKSVVEELEITRLSEQIINLLNAKRINLKEKMEEVALNKRVNNNYNRNLYNGSNFFSKKI